MLMKADQLFPGISLTSNKIVKMLENQDPKKAHSHGISIWMY